VAASGEKREGDGDGCRGRLGSPAGRPSAGQPVSSPPTRFLTGYRQARLQNPTKEASRNLSLRLALSNGRNRSRTCDLHLVTPSLFPAEKPVNPRISNSLCRWGPFCK
jgi:hypothetical protein